MRLTPQWSLYNRRLAAAAPLPAFDPETLFAASERGFILDLSKYNLAPTSPTPGTNLSRVFVYDKANGGANSVNFSQLTSANQPTYQLDGALPYIQFDGVNDWMSTSDITVSADAITVIAAFRRSQSTNMEDLIGLSANPPGNAGTFRMCPTFDASANNAAFACRGSGSDAGARAADTLTGVNYVLTGLGDISSDQCIVRRNGVQAGSSVADQGAGTWASSTFYLGSRGGTGRFFNGRLYALLVINRVLTGTELTNAEAWAAAKCGLTI